MNRVPVQWFHLSQRLSDPIVRWSGVTFYFLTDGGVLEQLMESGRI
jgi:hypothetical protein